MTRPVHMASLLNPNGDVSALCFAKPRPINLRVATWTNRREAVTCAVCATRLARTSERPEEQG